MPRKRDWSITQARAKLLEVIDRAVLDGPQEIWRNGKKAVVVLSGEEWERLQRTAPKPAHPEKFNRRLTARTA